MPSIKTRNQIEELLNNMNLGTQKVELGTVFVELLEQVASLEARIEELETPAE